MMYTTTVSQSGSNCTSWRESGSTHQLFSNFTLAWTPFWAPGFGVLSYWKSSAKLSGRLMPICLSCRLTRTNTNTYCTYCTATLWKHYTENGIEWLQGVWPKIIPVAMEMPIFNVNFSGLNYPNLKDESLGPYGWFDENVQSLVLKYGVLWRMARRLPCAIELHT